MKKLIALTMLSFGLVSLAGAHGGGLDENRCHTNHKTGVYHCHSTAGSAGGWAIAPPCHQWNPTMPKPLMLLLALFLPHQVLAWDGYDYEQGSHVEIEQGNLVREGKEIEFYDSEAGEYRSGEIESINRTGSTVELEIYDHESGEYRTFEMDD